MKAVLVALLVVSGAACSDTTDPAPPDLVVMAWLATLDGAGNPSQHVVPGQVPLLAAVERRGDATDILTEGLSPAAEADYWDSFATGIEAVAGVPLSQLVVGDVVVLRLDDGNTAFVQLTNADRSTTVVVSMGDDPILVDMIATAGPGLVRPLRSLIESVDPSLVDGPAVAASLRVGLSDPDLDLPPEFYGEVQDLIVLLDR